MSLMNVSISAVVPDLNTTVSGVQPAIALEPLVSAAFILLGGKVADLIAAIQAYLDAHNENPKPFIWTASIDSILEKVGRCKAVLETVH